ncbi:hypothetical protein MPNT_20129 [Candidatus Methylacidithermus pantelleriae]|uniref:Uncharacterized protein n=1 Tax=Candidatus Methylacidithermus pantelleriae TaxID=2744239 RepID=A0A8J2BKG9_9BACT|nr:hypothetical protein MPNT_20129 [Candidatus Methylacidithermus pantelleriae]
MRSVFFYTASYFQVASSARESRAAGISCGAREQKSFAQLHKQGFSYYDFGGKFLYSKEAPCFRCRPMSSGSRSFSSSDSAVILPRSVVSASHRCV